MADAAAPASGNRTALNTALWLAGFLILAFALRTAFSAGEGFDATSDRNLFTGNDPYYHLRTVTHVVTTGTNLNFDTAINYPEGNANPNPPLWTWTTAPLAAILGHTSIADPVGTALNIMVGFWGALTIIPCYMVANDLWGRKAGLWSAFFIAVSAPHIQRSIWGYADHDAISMFFIVLGFAFLVKALKAIDARRFITSWKQSAAVKKGLAETFSANRNSLVFAALAGTAIAACAVVWKGYPYALAIVAVAVFIQLFIDHLRTRDTTAVFLVYLTMTAIAVLLPWAIFYQHFPSFFAQTVGPSLYVLYGVIALGIILVPTRDLPSVLVFPALLVAGIAGFALLVYVFPAAGHKIFSGLGYFNQSKLYSTIAEAQRPRLGEVAANFGFFAFLVAFWGFGRTVRMAYKGDSSNVFMASWAIVALYMTFAASRFIMNAAPLFAILFSYAVVRILAKAGVGDEKKRYGTRRETPWKAGVAVALVGLLLVLPNVWTGVDAAMGGEFEHDNHLVNYTRGEPCTNGVCQGPYVHTPRFGAFGIDFELKSNGWLPPMEYLATRDTCKVSTGSNATCTSKDPNFQPLENRPAMIAWWDYGHWATGIGQHPAVADPFQSHFELSGRFLASDSEEEAMSWLTIHLLNGDYSIHHGLYGPEVTAVLTAEAPALLSMPHGYGNLYDQAYKVFHGNVTGDKVYTLYQHIEKAMDKSVGYFAVDDRMFPYDDPRTSGVERQSIFYAPVFLANKNPDKYMQFQFHGTVAGTPVTLTLHRYDFDANNNSYELPAPVYTDANNRVWTEYQGYAYPLGETPLQGYGVDHGFILSQSESMTVTPEFDSTMYAKAFGSLSTQKAAGDGLTHWRVVNEDLEASTQPGISIRRVALLEYFAGITVSGAVMDDAGQPMPGYQVSFTDGNGAHHRVTTTDAAGHFTVLAPFSQNNDVKLVVLGRDGSILASDGRSEFQFTEAEAKEGGARQGVTLTIKRGDVAGHVYVDTDADGKFNALNDTVLADAQISLAGHDVTSGKAGDFAVTNLQPSVYTATVKLAGYQNASPQVAVKSGTSVDFDIALVAKPSPATISFAGADHVGIADVEIKVQGPTATTVYTNSTGFATASLAPGDYQLVVDYNATTGSPPPHYTGHTALHVPFGGNAVVAEIRSE